MLIEIWSDYACPYCYIGEARLGHALRSLNLLQETEIVWKSFELDPGASREVTSTTPERFARKYGLPLSGALAQIEHISQLARDEGLTMRYASCNYANTFDAHRLAKYAAENGNNELHDRLFAAYFTENENIADHAVLERIAEMCGFEGKTVRAMLVSDAYADAVRHDEQEASHMGVHGVPYFVFDRKIAVSGVQPFDLMCQTLQNVSLQKLSTREDGAHCGPEGCAL